MGCDILMNIEPTIADEESDSYLAHHGILGMKWGVRKEEPTTNYQKVSQAKKNMVNADAKRASAKVKYKHNYKDWSDSYNNLATITRNWSKAGNYIRPQAEKNLDSAANSLNDYRSANKQYKEAKKAYKIESNKTNEAYAKSSPKMKAVDKYVFSSATQKQINNLMNNNKGMTVSAARRSSYTEAVINTAAIAGLSYFGYQMFNGTLL